MKQFIRIFMGGDVCGNLGLETLQKHLPLIIKKEKIDFCVVNGENTAHGVGIKDDQTEAFFNAGVDIITGGNHTLERFEIRMNFGKDKRVLRPHNFPLAQGSGLAIIEKNGIKYSVINLQGRENMRAIDCPFQSIDFLFSSQNENNLSESINIIDFHAESTMEKEALAFSVDGRVSVFAGTHTHTQTADERILPNGTAYITDLGMIGAKESVIGGSPFTAITRTKSQVPQRVEVLEDGVAIFCGLIAEIDIETKKAVSVKRIQISS